MSQQVGTLVGATVRKNDSLDTYPSFDANEGQGGLYSVATSAVMDAIDASCRRAGMQCYVVGEGNTYQLANDLVTWNLFSGAGGSGTTAPGSGGDSTTTTLLSGNFGEWVALTNQSASIDAANSPGSPYPIQSKSDLLAFPTRAIVYLQGCFSLLSTFDGTVITLGTITDTNSWPAKTISKYIIVQNIEMFLQIDTAGNVTLNSKDGFNLPTEATDPEFVQPYYVDMFFNPNVGAYDPTVYTATRTGTFTRNNCGSGYQGSSVVYTQTYTSTVSQATADALAANDTNFATAGQAYANSDETGGTCTVAPGVNNGSLTNTMAGGESVVVFFSDATELGMVDIATPPVNGTNYVDLVTTDLYQVRGKNDSETTITITVNGVAKTAGPAGTFVFDSQLAPIAIVLSD